MARLARKFFPRKRYALALARRSRVNTHVSWPRFPVPLPVPLPLSITLRLFATPLLASVGRAILLARLPTPPASSLLLTGFTAKMGSPMPRPEQPLASFEQTLPGPMMMTALWPLADVPKKMILVHGRIDSRCSSLGAKRQLRSEASYPRSPSILLYQTCPIARSTADAVDRPNARFWAAFRALLTDHPGQSLRDHLEREGFAVLGPKMERPPIPFGTKNAPRRRRPFLCRFAFCLRLARKQLRCLA